jgi:hypothetical protein
MESSTERFNLVASLASVLAQNGHAVRSDESWLVHEPSGFILIPQIVSHRQLENGAVGTTTTIQTNHDALIPGGIFEYQHATGDHLEASFREGFEQWTTTNFVALLEALQPSPKTALRFDFPSSEETPAPIGKKAPRH